MEAKVSFVTEYIGNCSQSLLVISIKHKENNYVSKIALTSSDLIDHEIRDYSYRKIAEIKSFEALSDLLSKGLNFLLNEMDKKNEQ